MEKGFTLLELLVSLAIVGILTATAIPAYIDYKKKAFDYRAMSDLRSAALAEEAYFLDQEEYLSCNDNGCQELPGLSRLSKGVSLNIEAGPETFVGTASHENGSGKTFRWDSAEGGFQTD